MNKKLNIILTVIGLIVLGIIGYVIDSGYFAKMASLNNMPPIVAVVREDLVGDTGNPEYVVVKFYSDNKEISDYLAVPIGNIKHDLDGKFAVAIHDFNSMEVRYIAEIDQNRALTASSSESAYPPFFADFLESGDVCFATNSTLSEPYILGCESGSILSILSSDDLEDRESADIEEIISDFEYFGLEVDFGEYPTSSVLLADDLAEDPDATYLEFAEVQQAYHKGFNIEINTDLLKFGAI